MMVGLQQLIVVRKIEGLTANRLQMPMLGEVERSGQGLGMAQLLDMQFNRIDMQRPMM